MIEVQVSYYFENKENRDRFYKEAGDAGIIAASRAEAGNLRYDYYYPIGTDAEIFLLEQWKDAEALKLHGEAEHYAALQKIKANYVTNVKLIKYTDVRA